jgi:hypothetical protein
LTKNNQKIVWSSGNLFSSQKENHEKPYHDAKYFKIFFLQNEKERICAQKEAEKNCKK